MIRLLLILQIFVLLTLSVGAPKNAVAVTYGCSVIGDPTSCSCSDPHYSLAPGTQVCVRTSCPAGRRVQGDSCIVVCPDGSDLPASGVCLEACPPAQTRVNGVCQCQAGFTFNTVENACKKDETCASRGDKDQSITWYGPVTVPPTLPGPGRFCIDGCRYSSGAGNCGTSESGKTACWAGKLWNQQTACTPGSGDSKTDPPPNDPSCGVGMCPGNVNGTNVCVPCKTRTTDDGGSGGGTGAGTGSGNGNGGTVGPTTTDSNGGSDVPGGSTTSTNTNTTTDSSTGQTTTTTTKTTTTNTDGVKTTKTDTTNTSKDTPTFCKENPNHTLCKTTTVTGQECSQTSVCNGDAVQCAILAKEKDMACALEASKGMADVALTIGTSSDPQKDTLAKGGTSRKEVDLKSFAPGPATVSGACPAPKTIPLPFGGSVTASFEPLCSLAPYIRLMLLFSTAIWCIIFISSKQGS